MSSHEKLPLRFVLPNQNANFLSIRAWCVKIGLSVESCEQEADSRFHSIAFQLPQAYLIYDSGWQYRLIFLHLWMSVGGEETDDLVAGDAHANGAADRFSCDLASDHVGVAGHEASEKLYDGDL